MSWRGRLSFTFAWVSVAACLMAASFAGAAPPPSSPQLGPLAPFKLADGTPKLLGPSIIDAVYRVTATAGAGNDSLFIIFNEDVNTGTVDATDFNFNGGLAVGDVGGLAGGFIARETRNLVVMTGFTTPYANGDSIQVAAAGLISGVDGSVSSDVSLIQIRTGPAIYRAEIIPDVYSSRPNADVLRLYFTHELVASTVSLTDPRLDFVMAEFGTGAANMTAALVGTKAIDITFGNQEAEGAASHGKMLAHISKIRVLAGALAGDFNSSGDGADDNSVTSPFHTVDSIVDAAGSTHRGPYLLAAGYNNKGGGPFTDDVLTLVFSDDVDPSTVAIADFGLTGATATQVATNDGDHIIEIRDLSAAPTAVSLAAGSILDFQGNPNTAITSFPVAISPIIVYARYQDGGDSDPATDIVELYFDTPVFGSTGQIGDFDLYGFDATGLIVTDNVDNDSLLTITGFTNSNNWEHGDRIGIDVASDIQSYGASGNGQVASFRGADATYPIRDFSAPRQLHFVLNQTYFRDAQTLSGADTAYYAFNEVDIDDSAYFLLFTRKNSPVDRIYIETHLNNAKYIVNPNPGYQANGDLNKILIGTYDISPGVATFSDGQIIQLGDNVNLGICAVDADGNIALNTTSCLFLGALVAGPVPPPRDHDCVCFVPAPGQLDPQGGDGDGDGDGDPIVGGAFADGCNPISGQTTDTDMIHIIGNRNPEEHFIFGDAGSAIGADSIRVYDDAALTILLGSGPANPITGVFNVFSIGQPTDDFVWVVAVDVVAGNSTLSSPTAIRNDLMDKDAVYASTFRDPLNSLRRYSPGDTVRVLGAASDSADQADFPVYDVSGVHKSDLLALSADFRGFSTRAGSDSVVFISLGANKNDEDNDWIDDGPTRFDNTAIAFNNLKDYPEPYVDENGDGVYNCGETFVDYSGTGYTPKIYDIGDSNLDANDPQEHGWYYVEYWIDPNDATLVADPDGGDNFATLDDVNIPVRVLDNAITSQASLDLLSNELPGQASRVTMTFGTDLSLNHLTNTAADSVFTATLDALAPTVSEISYLEKQSSLTDASSYPAGNIITPGDNVYELPSGVATPYINFVDSTLSDDDVIFVAVQIDDSPNSSSEPDAGWKYLSLDPVGDKADVGFPGIRNIDDDYDTTGVFGVNYKTDGLDNDEDGLVDEDGEGVDFSDPQVVDASQANLAADALAISPDTIHRGNDGIDNDNDAFFRYNPFTGAVVWFNVDEAIDNLVDDDGNGTVDDAGEVENYSAVLDDDEDGMQDGTVAFISLGGLNQTIAQLTASPNSGFGQIGVRAFEDPAQLAKYAGSKNTKPTAISIPGATPGSWLMSYLDKTSDTIGNVSTAFTQRGGKDQFGSYAFGARNIISPNFGGPSNLPYVYTGAFQNFDFNYRDLGNRNIDLNRIQAYYGLVDGSEYRMRAVAVDQAYNHNPNWAVPFRFTLDSVAPVVCIPPAQNSDTPGTGAMPEFDGFIDVKPALAGLQVYDKGAHPGPYTLRADVVSGSDIANVYFQIWNQGTETWDYMAANPANPDPSFPYTLYWDAPLLSNAPPADADTFYFRAYAVDEHGNTEAQFLDNDPPTPGNGPVGELCLADDRNWELCVIVIDGTAPSACLCQVGGDYDLSDGAAVPVEQAVDVSAWFTDNDGDPATNDVIHVYFEYTPIGLNSWSPLASLTGVPADGFLRDPSGIHHPVIVTGPDTLKTTVTWDTRTLAAGSYEIRAVAVDIEGNTSELTSCVFTVTLDNTALRAYIQPVVPGVNRLDDCAIAPVDTLFAQVFIHDRTVSSVEFEYYADTNGDGTANDGGSWIHIDTLGDEADERKGDVTLRAGLNPIQQIRTSSHAQINLEDGGRIKFWDPDGNGYSSIDPIIYDNNNDAEFNVGDTVLSVGPGNAQPSTGDPLTAFPDNEYFANIGGGFDQNDWVMQDNPLNAGDSQTDLWWVLWDVTGLNGNYLVRSIATDNLGNTDTDLLGSPIPVAAVEVDSDIPEANITSITLQDLSVINAPIDGDYVSGDNSYFYLNATTDDTDIKKVLFQYSVNGGVTWTDLDVNDDGDMYSDLNCNWQFDEGIDEIFVDADGSGTYTVGDIVLSKGDNGILDTPTDPSSKYNNLFPLVGEDPREIPEILIVGQPPITQIDNDGDGKINEDGSVAVSDLGGQSPDDYFAPYSVPFLFHNIMFPTETNVLFRSIAMDLNGNTDCDPDPVSVVVGDNKAPETDVVVAVINGDSLDIETVLRGTLNPYCLDSLTVGPMHLLVTVEDQAEILEVDIYYRSIDYDAFPPVEYQPAGIVDSVYPYEFVWDIEALADGEYEFFASALDANGNRTMAPMNPYRFSINRNTGTVASAVFLGSNLVASDVHAGDVVVLTASVSDPTIDGSVCFYYAERIEGETVTGISTTFPYVSGALNESVQPNSGNGLNETVFFSNGQEGIWVDPALFNSTPAKTYRHYTVRNTGAVIEFGAAIPNGVTVTIDYNITNYSEIDCDQTDPYSVEWTVPSRDENDATHYDISAGFYPNDQMCGDAIVSEGFQLKYIDVEGSEFVIHGIDDIGNDGDINLLDNAPGNALCVSQGLGFDGESEIGTQVNKLSGDWAEFFVTTEENNIEQVKMIVYHTFDLNGADSDTCMMVENPLEADPPQPVHKVLYESDFPTLDPDRVENVTITVSGYTSGASSRTFAMYDDGATGDDLAANDGHWTVLLSLDPGHTYTYTYTIDLVGSDFISTNDPRHNESQILIPAVPYWWCSARLDDDHLIHQNAINHVHVEVTDSEGNVTSNLSENNQGQIDVILDRVAPTVAALSIDRAQVAPGGDVEVFATITDPTPADINIITVTEVLFQVSPDASRDIWLDWFTQDDPSNGWGGLKEWPFNPLNDNIDNDLDGTFDEADESAFVYWIRAVAIDDCHNHGYSDRQNPQVVVPVTVDATPPVCKLAAPTNGSIYSIGSTITLTTAPSTDTDVLYVSFQYNTGDGWYAIDATPIDDTDELDGFEGEHTPATVKNEDGTYSVNWNTAFLTETDFYVRLRCVARDIAGNFTGGGDPFDTGVPPIEYVTILMNDDIAPLAALTHVADTGPAYILKSIVDPTLAINDQVLLIGTASGGRNGDVATVQLQYSTNGTTWLDGGVTNVLTDLFVSAPQTNFFIIFNTTALGLADGPVWLRTAAVDHDGNVQGDANGNGILESSETVPGAVKVTVDNSEPAMWLTQVGPVFGSPVADHTLIQYDLWPREVMRGSQFELDSALRLADDLTFQASDPNDGSTDVLNATFLQFYDDWTDQEHPTWQPAFPPIPEIDADNNGAIDESEIEDFVANLFFYNVAFINFLEDAEGWRFAYRDGTGNNGPAGAPQDGRWYLQFGSIGSLKEAMAVAAGGFDGGDGDGDGDGDGEPSGIQGNLTPQGAPANLPDKEYQYRALTMDYAGNANTGYIGHTLRIDATNPTVEEIFAGNNEIEGGGGGGIQITPSTVQVAGGDDVPLAALVFDDYPVDAVRGPGSKLTPQGFDPDLPGTDSESSGIWGVRFEFQTESGDGSWHNIGLGSYDSENGLWEIDWTTPNNLARGSLSPQQDDGSSTTDSLYAIRATAVDSAGNVGFLVREDAVNVQDHTPPDDTEIVDINPNGGATYPPATNEETVRAPDGTWVAGNVEVIAATQYGDPSMLPGYSDNNDVFSPTVFFEARLVGSSEWTVLGTSTEPVGGGYVAPAPGVTSLESHLGPRWTVQWNTLQINGGGQRIWADGQYDVRAWGRDVWGNTEIITNGEAPMTVRVTIDNTAPVAEVDADWRTGGREVEATVERNNTDGYTILVRTADNTEDVTIQYYYKLSTDLNVADSWTFIDEEDNGFDESDENPDQNRPYSFDWNTNAVANCDDVLIPGETYDIGFSATDLLGNTLSVVAAHDAGYTSRLHVVDTIAPRATITELQREVGNSDIIEFPVSVRLRALNYLQATILSGQRDGESVQFWFTPKTSATAPAFSSSTWTLADGDIDEVGDQTWRLRNWDSSTLAEGEWWFAAVAEDCYDNRDTAPPAIILIIDRTGPTFAGVNPDNGEVLVPEVTDCFNPQSPRVIDLIVRNLDNDVDYTTFNDNNIVFQYKKSETADREENWYNITSQELRNGGTGSNAGQTPTYSAAINLRNLQGDGLYDFRVCASDVAGNFTYYVFSAQAVVDNSPPVIEISYIQFLNRIDDDVLDLTPQPVNGGILPDISAGEQIRLYVTASDDEPEIPNTRQPGNTDLTGVYEIQFYLIDGPNGSGTYPQNLGTAAFDAATGQYYVVWNTSALPDGDYTIEAQGQDDVRNCTYSQTVTGNVSNPAKPLAQVAAFNPDLLSEITKGTNSRVYGLTFGEKLASTMFFQYRVIPATGSPSQDWINIGAANFTGEVLTTRELSLLPQSLWFSNMRISDIANDTNIDFRAVAVASSSVDSLGLGGTIATEPVNDTESNYYGRTVGAGFAPADGDPGDFSGLYDTANTPILRMTKRSGPTGQAYLEYVQSLAGQPELITAVNSQGVEFTTNTLISVTTTGGTVSPFVVIVGEDGTGAIDETILEVNRRIDNPLIWTGDFRNGSTDFTDLDPTEGARIGVFATAHLKRTTAEQAPPRIDMATKMWTIHQVTPAAGSNGIAGIEGRNGLDENGCPRDGFAFEVPSGAFDYNMGMLLDTVNRPVTPTEQDLYLSAFGPTYRVYFMNSDWEDCDSCADDNGWQSNGWMRYDDTNPAIRTEAEVTVRRWTGSGWSASGISHIEVDTLNNCIAFNYDPNSASDKDLNPIFSAVTTDRFSPVQVDAVPFCRGYTDQDPIFKAVLTNQGEAIDPGTIRVFVDGREVAAVRNYEKGDVQSASTSGGYSHWLLYNSSWLDVEQISSDGRRYEVTFGWPCDNATELQGGQHTYEVWFSDYSRSTFFGVGQPWTFEVDRTPPTIVMNGAFVGDPRQNTAVGYIGEETDAITVKLIDRESGVLFREDRIDDDDYSHYWWDDVEDYCAIARYAVLYDEWFYENDIPIQFDADNSFKYDLWVVDAETEDDQTSVDEIEERTLLHTGTADELWPNVTTSEDGDTLTVPLYILGGGRIKDGDVLEVVLYSKRYEIAPITNLLNEYLDQISGQGGQYGSGWWIDFSTKRLVQYASSIQDCINNAGSRFVEQRFIVDKGAPEVEVTSPGVSCDGTPVLVPVEPVADYTFHADFTDLGAGVDPSTVTVTVTGPTAENDEDGITLNGLEVTAEGVTFTIPLSDLLVGQYRIRIQGEDQIGNKFDKTCVLFVGGNSLALGNVVAFPNPFNPSATDLTLAFDNVKAANVSVEVFDWNGDRVSNIAKTQLPAGRNVIKWAGQTEDGKPLANGVYLARIEANDGIRTVTQVLKIAVWRD